MHRTTLISIGVAGVLAIGAALLTERWLATQRTDEMPEISPAAVLQPVVIATRDLQAGERLTAGDFEVIQISGWKQPEGVFVSVDELVSAATEARFVISTIYRGEVVLAARVSRPGQPAKMSAMLEPGMRAVSIRVNDVQGVAGFVLPGDRVDVLLAHGVGPGATQDKAYVDVILQNVKVIAIDQSANSQTDQPSVVRTVTFAVLPEQAQKLTLASEIGTLALALRNAAEDGGVPPARLSADDLGLAGPLGGTDTAAPPNTPGAPPATATNPTLEVGVLRDGKRQAYPVVPRGTPATTEEEP